MADRLSELQSTAHDGEASPTGSGFVTPVRGTDHIVRRFCVVSPADLRQKGAIEAHQAMLRDPSIVRPSLAAVAR